MKWLVIAAILLLMLAVVAAGPCDQCEIRQQVWETPTPRPTVAVPWLVDCTDEIKENGYEFQGRCVPGAETYDASRFENPGLFSGVMSSYAKGIMEKVAANRGYGLGGYRGGVALMGCGDIGKKVYIRRPGHSWDGPFLAVDCSSRWGVYDNIMLKGLAVEVDHQTADRYGAGVLPWVDVRIEGNSGGAAGMSLASWYLENALSFSWTPALIVPTATAVPTARPTPTASPIPTDIPVPVAPEPLAPTEEPGMIATFWGMLFLLLSGHGLADFALQSDKMGFLKRRSNMPQTDVPYGERPVTTWFYWLSAHSLIHGGLVAAITGDVRLGLAEAVCHGLLDFARGERMTSVHFDQAGHILCKVAWAALAIWA